MENIMKVFGENVFTESNLKKSSKIGIRRIQAISAGID